MVEIRSLGPDGVFEIQPQRSYDKRGFFSETYSSTLFKGIGLRSDFVQDNHSYSARAGCLRGLHYQAAPRAQMKLVRVLRGRIYDVAVDLRGQSDTFGQWVGVELSAKNWNQLLIPEGFAHGFLTLENDTEVAYKVTHDYHPASERTIRYDDPLLGIHWPWPRSRIHLSEKDAAAPYLISSSLNLFGFCKEAGGR